jgi:hypothetical protein
MTPQHLLRSLARVFPLFLLSLAMPPAALGQSAAPGPWEIAPETRARVARAAEDTMLAPWQRDLMLGLARTGRAAALDSSAAGPRAALPTLAANGVEGAWVAVTPPSGRNCHSAIYDPVRDRMVVFGGIGLGSRYLNDVWTLSLAGTPAWTQLTPTGTAPSQRTYHSAIYDPVRDRMVVFGGGAGSRYNDVWALSLAGTPAWTQLTPSGTPPSARISHSAVYDPVRDRMVVFGGVPVLNDVWALSLAGAPAWTQLTPAGTPPLGRANHSAIYDPVRDRMVVFGGSSVSGYLNDVWALSLPGTPAWTQLSSTGAPPSPRVYHSAIYDSVRDRMVVFGGVSLVSGYHNDVWALSLAGTPAWAQVAPTATPPSRRGTHSAIYDPVRDRMVVFGGSVSSRFNDVWGLSLAGTPTWTQLTPVGTPPSGPAGHSAIYDPVRGRMVVFGGVGSSFNDVWTLSLADTSVWTQLSPAGTPPSGRFGHSAIYDPVRDRMVVFGGYSGSYFNEVWALSLADTPVWAQLSPSGTPPGARSAHSAIYDPVRDRMVVFGGSSVSGYVNDVWALSLADTPVWAQLTPTGTPSVRNGHGAIYDPLRDRMVVFGGGDASSYRNDIWALTLADTLAWAQLTPSGSLPNVRLGHSASYDPLRDRMVVFGGLYSDGSYHYLNDAWALALAGTPAWMQLTPSGATPSGRRAHSAIYDPVRDRIVVFGGYDASQYYCNDAWALGWNFVTAVDDPEARPLVSGLRPPAPNPTRATTAVTYALAQAGRIQLGVYDVSGRLVRRLVDGERRAGTETVVWNGTAESGARQEAGVYFVRLAGPGFRETRRVILLR